MKNPLDVCAQITLVSKEKLDKKFDFANVGGFDVILPNENNAAIDPAESNQKSVAFDWQGYAGNSFVTDDGRMGITFSLTDFDADHWSGNETGQAPDWERILKGTFDEITYEAVHYDKASGIETQNQMEITEFAIGETEDFTNVTWHNFPKETIDAYNEKANAEWVATAAKNETATPDAQA